MPIQKPIQNFRRFKYNVVNEPGYVTVKNSSAELFFWREEFFICFPLFWTKHVTGEDFDKCVLNEHENNSDSETRLVFRHASLAESIIELAISRVNYSWPRRVWPVKSVANPPLTLWYTQMKDRVTPTRQAPQRRQVRTTSVFQISRETIIFFTHR